MLYYLGGFICSCFVTAVYTNIKKNEKKSYLANRYLKTRDVLPSDPIVAHHDSLVFVRAHMWHIHRLACRGFAIITEKVIRNRRDFIRSLKALDLIQRQMKSVCAT